MVTFYRHGQDALGQGTVNRLMEGDIAEERMDGRQSDVSAAGTIAAFFFEVIKEGTDEGGIKIIRDVALMAPFSNAALQTRGACGRCRDNLQWYEGLPAAGA